MNHTPIERRGGTQRAPPAGTITQATGGLVEKEKDKDTERAEDVSEAAAGKPASRRIVLLALGVVGAAAGAWLGGPILTPLVAGVFAGGGGHGEEAGGGGHGAGEASAPTEPLFELNDLVVNPAGSGGTRFLVAAISLDADAEAQEALAARSAEARDLLLTVLGSHTVDQLSDVSYREDVRSQLRSTLNGMLGYEGVHRIFFPQFVIQ